SPRKRSARQSSTAWSLLLRLPAATSSPGRAVPRDRGHRSLHENLPASGRRCPASSPTIESGSCAAGREGPGAPAKSPLVATIASSGRWEEKSPREQALPCITSLRHGAAAPSDGGVILQTGTHAAGATAHNAISLASGFGREPSRFSPNAS